MRSYLDKVMDVNDFTAVQERGRQVRGDDQLFSVPLVTAAGLDRRMGQPGSRYFPVVRARLRCGVKA